MNTPIPSLHARKIALVIINTNNSYTGIQIVFKERKYTQISTHDDC